MTATKLTDNFKIETLTSDELVLVPESGLKMQFQHVQFAAPAAAAAPTDRPEGPAMHVAPPDRETLAKLVGLWEIRGQNGVSVKFARDGRFTLSSGKTGAIDGTFKLADNKITLTIKNFDGKESSDTLTIKSLSDEQLVTVDSKGKEETLKRPR